MDIKNLNINIEEYDYDTIISKVKNEFNARNINALLSRYGNNIVGCFQNVDKTAAVSNAECNVSDNNTSYSSISEINPVNLYVKNIHNTDIGREDELDEKEVLDKIYNSLSEYISRINSDIKRSMWVGRA